MARLPKDEVQEREQFIKELFLANPTLPMPQANTKFFERFGSKMRPQRVYDIREQIQTQLDNKVAPKDITLTPAKNRKENQMTRKKKSKTAKQTSKPPTAVPAARGAVVPNQEVKLVPVEAGHESAVADALTKMKKLGAFKGRVDHQGPGYLVVSAE